jgi:hypothetical protein
MERRETVTGVVGEMGMGRLEGDRSVGRKIRRACVITSVSCSWTTKFPPYRSHGSDYVKVRIDGPGVDEQLNTSRTNV